MITGAVRAPATLTSPLAAAIAQPTPVLAHDIPTHARRAMKKFSADFRRPGSGGRGVVRQVSLSNILRNARNPDSSITD